MRWAKYCMIAAGAFLTGVMACGALRADETSAAVTTQGAAAPVDQPLNPMADPPQIQTMPVLAEYDRFQDKTTLRVEGIRPAITRGVSRLFINATCSFDGQSITEKPDKVQFNLLAVSDDYQYADTKDDLQLIFLIAHAPAKEAAATKPSVPPLPNSLTVDSAPTSVSVTQPTVQRVRIPVRFIKAGTTKDANSKCLESFVAIVDSDVLVQLATAPLVEGQLGGCEFKLGAMEKLSLRHFAEQAKLIAPETKEQSTEQQQIAAGIPVHVDAAALHMAQAKVDAAQEKMNAATEAVLNHLRHNKEYTDAAKSAADLEARKDATPAGPQRTQISQQWLEARAKVNLLKSSAMLEDPALTAARNELNDAQNALRALQLLSVNPAPHDEQR